MYALRIVRYLMAQYKDIELTNQSAFSFQGHPEASPGPHDLSYLFDKFVTNIKAAKG